MRASSIRPLNQRDSLLCAPMPRGRLFAAITVPAGTARLDSNTPLMYRRMVVPSKVAATCIQVPSIGYSVVELTRYLSALVSWLIRKYTLRDDASALVVARLNS